MKRQGFIKWQESPLSCAAFAISSFVLLMNVLSYLSSSVHVERPTVIAMHFMTYEKAQYVEPMMSVAVLNTGRDASEATYRRQSITMTLPDDFRSRCNRLPVERNERVFGSSRKAFDLERRNDGTIHFRYGESATPFFVKSGETYVQTTVFSAIEEENYMDRALFRCWVEAYDEATFTYRIKATGKGTSRKRRCNVTFDDDVRRKVTDPTRNYIPFVCEDRR